MKKTNIFNRIKAQYQKLVDYFDQPRTKLVWKRKTSDITLKILRTTLLFGLCFVILFPTIQQSLFF